MLFRHKGGLGRRASPFQARAPALDLARFGLDLGLSSKEWTGIESKI
jgi:hypothetical protein